MKDRTDIAEQPYKGPNKWISAGALGAVEAKIAALVGLFGGGAVGAIFHKPINGWINKSPLLKQAVEQGSDMLGGKSFGKMFGGTGRFNAAVLSALVWSTVLPIGAFVHGMWAGWKSSDEGKKQFDEAKAEITNLRRELADRPLKHTGPATHIQAAEPAGKLTHTAEPALTR